MKLKRLAISSFVVLAGTFVLVVASHQISHEFPPPTDDIYSHPATYYDPHNVTPTVLYQAQQRSSNYDTNGFHCEAILDPAQTSARGWPFAYLFTVDYGCPGTYTTFAPTALAANIIIFLLVCSLAGISVVRVRKPIKA